MLRFIIILLIFMPAAFDACRANGGKIRTKKIGKTKYMHICINNGKSYPGEVKTKKAKKAKKSNGRKKRNY